MVLRPPNDTMCALANTATHLTRLNTVLMLRRLIYHQSTLSTSFYIPVHSVTHYLCVSYEYSSIFFQAVMSFCFFTLPPRFSIFFFFNDPAPPEISPFPLHDPLPI